MEIQFLADCPEVIGAIACLQQMEMKLKEKSNYQKRGIGLQLIKQIELIAANMGYQQYLFTWTAETYYRKLEWTVIDTTVPEGLPESVVMQKIL